MKAIAYAAAELAMKAVLVVTAVIVGLIILTVAVAVYAVVFVIAPGRAGSIRRAPEVGA